MRQNWFYHPSKQTLILFNLTWLIGAFLLLAVMTDLFSSSPFKGQYLVLHFLLAASAAMVIRLNLNFQKSQNI
jgi:hypothetical protein